MDGCTFKPQTLDYVSTGQHRQSTHGDKCIDLYSTKPKGWFKDKPTKDSNDYEFEKATEECTFTPRIIDPTQVDSGSGSNVQNIRGVDKQMDRMIKAR